MISKYKIGYDSNNLLFSELSLASSWFRLGERISLDRYIESKNNGSLSKPKGYTSESFLSEMRQNSVFMASPLKALSVMQF